MAHNPLRADPSRTITLRRKFIADFERRFRELRKEIFKLILGQDVFGLIDDSRNDFFTNAEQLALANGVKLAKSLKIITNVQDKAWRFETDERKVTLFNEWFKQRLDQGLLSVADNGDSWTAEYVDSAYRKGVNRAFIDTRKVVTDENLDFFEGTKAEFLSQAFDAPETVSKLRLLKQRTFENLKGMTSNMSSQMSTILADGLSAGLHPRQIASEMNRRIEGINRTRARAIARTEIIHAHAEGQLDSFERLGVEELSIMAEWSTAGDDRVCPMCGPLDGAILTVKEARGLLPRHPNCRCAFVPSLQTNKLKTKETQSSVKSAIDKSVKAEHPNQTAKEAKESSTWLGPTKTISKSRTPTT